MCGLQRLAWETVLIPSTESCWGICGITNGIKPDIIGPSANCTDGSFNLVRASYFRMAKETSSILKGKKVS